MGVSIVCGRDEYHRAQVVLSCHSTPPARRAGAPLTHGTSRHIHHARVCHHSGEGESHPTSHTPCRSRLLVLAYVRMLLLRGDSIGRLLTVIVACYSPLTACALALTDSRFRHAGEKRPIVITITQHPAHVEKRISIQLLASNMWKSVQSSPPNFRTR